MIVGIDLIGVPVWTRSVQGEHQHLWRVQGVPVISKGGPLPHRPIVAVVAGTKSADVHHQRKLPSGLGGEGPGQQDRSAEVDGAAVEGAEGVRVEAQMVDPLGVGRKSFGIESAGQDDPMGLGTAGVEFDSDRFGNQVSRGVQQPEVAVGHQHRLNPTRPGWNVRHAGLGKGGGDSGDLCRLARVDSSGVDSQETGSGHRRGAHLLDRLGLIGRRENQDEASGEIGPIQAGSRTNLKTAAGGIGNQGPGQEQGNQGENPSDRQPHGPN